MFNTVLIANRGEIARRIIRTLDRLGIRSVAVYSESEAKAPHALEATAAVCIGPDPASSSYLNIERVIEAARDTGAEAIHPGYGFLAENVAFARACEEAGIVFIGPGTRALDLMGDKARSRAHVSAHGVPIVPGFTDSGRSDDEIEREAERVGYPLLIKPSAGGGGKGMEEVRDPEQLLNALASARRVARSAFGDDELVIERLIDTPRHIEVQVFADTHGNTLALGERECTLQRRHQKVIEEAPSIAIDEATRTRLCQAAVNAAVSVDYVGAGTVEFLIDAQHPTEFSFIEMNTRLQVEHPVTEEVTGIDLVEWQLRVAAGEPLPHIPQQHPQGHAIEARIYAESPERGFLPSVGTVLEVSFPSGVRVDSAVEQGSEVSPYYDPMIAKLIAHAPTRTEALDKLDRALTDTVILGVNTNIAFLRTLIADQRVRTGTLDTGLIQTLLPVTAPALSGAALAAVAAEAHSVAPVSASPPWGSLRGWRMNRNPEPHAPVRVRDEDGQLHTLTLESVNGFTPTGVDAQGGVWVSEYGHSARFEPVSRRDLLFERIGEAGHQAGRNPDGVAPMPGTVSTLHVKTGDRVQAGAPLVSVEAMKMEHSVTAQAEGIVTIHVTLGEQVQRGTVVATVTPNPATPQEGAS